MPDTTAQKTDAELRNEFMQEHGPEVNRIIDETIDEISPKESPEK